MGFIHGILGLSIVILLTVLCVSNLHPVEVMYSPVHDGVMLPLYAVILGLFLVGFLLGSFMVWLNGLPGWWAQRRKIKTLEKEIKKETKKEQKARGKTAGADDKDLVSLD